MIIVQGTFNVEPDQRDSYLEQTLEMQRTSRSEKGCIEYVFAADPLDPARVVLSERWQSKEDLDAHLTALNIRRDADREAGVESLMPLSREVVFIKGEEFQL